MHEALRRLSAHKSSIVALCSFCSLTPYCICLNALGRKIHVGMQLVGQAGCLKDNLTRCPFVWVVHCAPLSPFSVWIP